MNEIQSTLLTLLPPKRKHTPSGWTSFNAVCCQHNGEKSDTRARGGIMTSPDGGFQYHCFNCGFKAGWSPGKLLSSNTKKLYKWLGLSDDLIGKLNIVALKIKDDIPTAARVVNLELKEVELPEDSLSFTEWAEHGCTDPEFVAAVEYILDRGMGLDWYNWMWSPSAGYKDRVLIPFYQDKKVVGYTGRKVTDGKPKYLTDSQSGYVFNIDNQTRNREYVLVVEGQFDAISVDGVAIMTNEPNEAQVLRINALGREVIVIPDRDRPGSKMLKHAIKNNWSVSLPPWGDEVKDVADAVRKFGRLYVLATILHYRVAGEIKINLIKKKLESLDE